MSTYELIIAKILNKEKIRYSREKTFSDLKGGKYRYDFYIEQLNIIIEVDGEYHFKPIRGKRLLTAQQARDRRKNSYCLANNIKLYRIPYWELKNIKSFKDCVKEEFCVKSKWHNDILVENLKV